MAPPRPVRSPATTWAASRPAPTPTRRASRASRSARASRRRIAARMDIHGCGPMRTRARVLKLAIALAAGLAFLLAAAVARADLRYRVVLLRPAVTDDVT